MPVTTEVRVRYAETDQMGIVYYANYLVWFEIGRVELLRALGLAPVAWAHVALPIGISFYVFKLLSYAIDVHRRRIPAETHVGYFALYVVFFPQLVAGPIERSTHLLPALRERRTFDFRRMSWAMYSCSLVRMPPLKRQMSIVPSAIFSISRTLPSATHGHITI